jgi:hypothetical protein
MERLSLEIIESTLRHELHYRYSLIENTTGFMFRTKHFEKQITKLEDVHEINSNYDNLRNKFLSIDFDDKLWSLKRGEKLNWFLEVSEDIIEFRGDSYFYMLLSDVITDIELPHGYKDEILELIGMGENPTLMMQEEEKQMFDDLPSTLLIYRGVCLKEDNLDIEDYISLNWTLDFEVAKWFSNLGGGYKSLVLKYEISKDEILSYFTRRKEFEIIVNFENIEIENVETIIVNRDTN